MVLKPPKLKLTPPKPFSQGIGTGKSSWRPAVVSLVDATRIPMGAVTEAKNCMQTQDGVWSTRWGSRDYGDALNGPITGIAEYTKTVDGVTEQYIIAMDNGVIRSSKDGGSWTDLSDDYTFTTTVTTRFLQFEDKILIANGVDPFSYFDINGGTLVQFTGLSTPTGLSSSLSNLSSGTFPLYYQITALSDVGETVGSAVETVNVNIARNNWYQSGNSISTSSPAVTVSWDKVTDAIGYSVYMSDGVSGVAYYLASIGQPSSGSTVSFVDYGINAVNDFIQVPVSDTTTAPEFSWIALSNNRLWACGDPNSPNRIYWAGTGQQYNTAFNAFVGGGWVDILPGSTMKPTTIVEFRSGQGNPLTTVLLAEPSGYGATYHIDLQSDQIGTTTIIVPAVIKAVGTFGTLSPYGVVETNENLYFHSGTGGFFSTGTQATMFNILATNEVSIMVRPDVKALFLKGLSQLCGLEYDRKIFWSVPFAESTNNRIMVYDLEKLNWNPFAFDFGVKQFIRYTDNSAITHLIAIPMTGTTLLEINENFTNDNGVAYESKLATGTMHVTPDHFGWAHFMYLYIELLQPQGYIDFNISGTPHNEVYQQLESVSALTGSVESNAGFSSYAFSQVPFSYDSVAPEIVTEATSKYRIMINRIVNNWSFQIVSSNSNNKWQLSTLLTGGELIPLPAPSSWIIGG